MVYNSLAGSITPIYAIFLTKFAFLLFSNPKTNKNFNSDSIKYLIYIIILIIF